MAVVLDEVNFILGPRTKQYLYDQLENSVVGLHDDLTERDRKILRRYLEITEKCEAVTEQSVIQDINFALSPKHWSIHKRRGRWESREKYVVEDANGHVIESYVRDIGKYLQRIIGDGVTEIAERMQRYNIFRRNIVIVDDVRAYHEKAMDEAERYVDSQSADWGHD